MKILKEITDNKILKKSNIRTSRIVRLNEKFVVQWNSLRHNLQNHSPSGGSDKGGLRQ